MAPAEATQSRYGAAASALLRLWPRLIVAYGFVVALVTYAWPQISVLIAHAARSLILASNPLPHVVEISWTETGYLVSDGILGSSLYLQTPSLRLMFGFPLGLALALPGHRGTDYWRRVAGTLIASVLACSLLLAIMADWYVATNLSRFGIEVHAGWHHELLGHLGRRFWDLAILYPFLACLVLGRGALKAVGAGSASGHPGAPPPHRSWLRRGNLAVLAGVLLLLAIELRAQHSLNREGPELAAALLERNPEVGNSFLRFAKTLETGGKQNAAAQWYREASKHKVSRRQAKRALKRLRPGVQDGEPARRSR